MEYEDTNDQKNGLAMLQAWREGQGPAEMPDSMQLAAWLEGRLDEASASEVERALAADSLLLQSVLELRQMEEPVTGRAKISSTRHVSQLRNPAVWLVEWLAPIFRPSFAVAALAVLMVTGFGGFELGRDLAIAGIEQQQLAMRALMADDTSLLQVEG